MENNNTLLSDKQIVKAKLNTAADSFLSPLLYTCSLYAACQTCTNKKKPRNSFSPVYLSLVRLSYVSFTCLPIWNTAALRRGGCCWRWSPLSLSLPKPTPLGLSVLAPVPSLLLSFARVVCSPLPGRRVRWNARIGREKRSVLCKRDDRERRERRGYILRTLATQ